MNSKFTAFVTFAFLMLAGASFAMSQARAQAQTQAGKAGMPPADTSAAAGARPGSNPGEITFDNGVKMEVLRAADGPKPASHAIVQLQYIGHLEDGTEFTRSYSRRHPSIYALSDVIGCWQTGIPEMHVGSKVRLTCPPGSANGRRPVDFIRGDTTLYFVIELIAIVG